MILQSAFNDAAALATRCAGVFDVEFARASAALLAALDAGHKVLVCGNGGSAADAQHFAAELTGRFERERRSLAALALTTDTSALTAIGNDYGFDHVFARQVEALGRAGDVLIAISTSGNSSNVLNALKAAKACGMATAALTGEDGGACATLADVVFRIPSHRTCRIQEMHMIVLHALCIVLDEGVT